MNPLVRSLPFCVCAGVVACNPQRGPVVSEPVVTPIPARAAELPAFELPAARTSLQAPSDAWPVYVSTTALFSGSLQNRVADLPSREAQSASGFGPEHKRATPNDLFLVTLTNALTTRKCDANGTVSPRAIVHAHPTTSYRILIEVLFTLAQSAYSEIYLAVKPVDARVPRQAHAVRLSTQEASGVTIFIVNDGFSVYGLDRNRVGTGCAGTEVPTIPRVQGSPDYAGLSRCLHQLVVGETPVPLAITANPGTDLQTLVSVVDAASDANPVAFPSTFSAKVPASPGPSTGNGAETPATGNLPTAASTVRGLQESFRACYDAMLTRRPDSTGGVRLSMRVGEDGSVQSVAASPTGTVDEQLVTCVRQIAMNARFDRPTGGPVAIVVPITFQPKDAKPRSPACRRAEP